MPRISRLALPGVPLHVVQRGNNRQPCFFHPSDYQFYLESALARARRYQVAVHAYVLMTNHVHLLLTPMEKWSVSRMMQLLGATYVSNINSTYRRTGTLWEGRYKSSLVDSERYCLACYRYIELNPVRALMCKVPEDYQWSSYGVNALGSFNPGIQPHEQWKALADTDVDRYAKYRQLVEGGIDQDNLERIRYCIQKGLPTGSNQFKSQIEDALERRLGSGRRGRPKLETKKGL
jgi:putative transposase